MCGFSIQLFPHKKTLVIIFDSLSFQIFSLGITATGANFPDPIPSSFQAFFSVYNLMTLFLVTTLLHLKSYLDSQFSLNKSQILQHGVEFFITSEPCTSPSSIHHYIPYFHFTPGPLRTTGTGELHAQGSLNAFVQLLLTAKVFPSVTSSTKCSFSL